MTAKIIGFGKPAERARLKAPNANERAALLSGILDFLVKMEADPDFVGFAVIGLMSTGMRRSSYGANTDAWAQLARQVRHEAADIAKAARKGDA